MHDVPEWRSMMWGSMDEYWLTALLFSRWVIAAAAFALGMFVGGRVLQPDKTSDPDVEGAQEKSEAKSSPGDHPKSDQAKSLDDRVSKKLDALDKEIQMAKAALKDEDNIAPLNDVVTSLEETVKRANGRLKLIEKSIKKSKADF